ncbi:MAG: pyrroline-5-carboxylate reductase [Corynebacterium sp.]|uniref:pyrroline-5-carboxylate reductase n=1 Tax=Corynebacterium TaxID=1716 RepID=UPI0026479AE7|nr:pyrroline-5-carboxylate reductase [Corynebacterium sp.]MDN5724031.1 pyrroline-5-carboxylate reductase [Corynebacterium sp.]MDN6281919.1 pyrroline-5-carboxylate reductase [Corynebacterium sp.]MDN6305432.1 pyrroline-5-carboxylate reductase [Corynebacterium sp.]MDN6367667.1 pyrroline-5-carboxylate reductase [Corynebacterium sp.]MDN6375454.1 pyrroline-5-carboxylate reductase [Corynebacterium sp.]
MTRIAFIGGGNIGEALMSGLVGNGEQGDKPDIVVFDPSTERVDVLRERYGVIPADNAAEATSDADIVVIAVKPYIVGPVLDEISSTIDNNDTDTIVVSVAAGVSLASMESSLAAGVAVVRVMPNTPMLVGKGMSAIAGGRFASAEQVEAVRELFATVGSAVAVAEKDIDAVTAVSGSGPAYLFLVGEAMTDAGVQLGLTRDVAQQLAVATIEGAATMMAQGDLDPVQLRANVTSPGGTTAAATRTLEENGIRAAFFRAMQACADKSQELGRPSDS